jgi:transcriptional regulator with XRE-family HTH domain
MKNESSNTQTRLYPRPKRLGVKLQAIRRHLGLSQTQLKNRIEFPGEYGRISEFERGKRQPNVLTILAYARLAGVPMDDLVDDDIELTLILPGAVRREETATPREDKGR